MLLKLTHRTLGLGIATMAFIMAIAVAASVTAARSSKLPLGSPISGPEEKMVSSLIVKPRAGAGDQIASALQAFQIM
jgi:hypothetical protein